MKTSVLRFSLLALNLALGLTACGNPFRERLGPTDNFRSHDVNGDTAIDRVEWENPQGSGFPESLGFRYADCDTDGRLTWPEYARGYRGSEHCPGSYLYEDPPFVPVNPDVPVSASASSADFAQSVDGTPDLPLVVRAGEEVQIFASPFTDVDMPTQLRRRLPAPPGRYSEMDLSVTQMNRVKLANSPVSPAELISHYDTAEKIPGYEVRMVFPRLICEVVNENPDVRLTMVDLQIVWREHGQEHRARHLKTLWTDPRSAQAFHVWFGAAVETAECRLLHVRGQPAN